MSNIFEIKDCNNKEIHLSQERWQHIVSEHPELAESIEEIEETLKNPTVCKMWEFDEQIKYFYKYFKYKSLPARYLLVIVKYLNGEGFIITAYLMRQIK